LALTLHPWLSSPEAVTAAHRAVQIPLALMGGRALLVGADELLSEAFAILAECAMPPSPVTRPECARCGIGLGEVRRGAKFCSARCRMGHAQAVRRLRATPLPPSERSHVGSMWAWPASERSKFATREVGYELCNWLRTRHHALETPSSEQLARMEIPAAVSEESPEEFITAYLECHGIRVTGEEAFTELAEAARHVRDVA
jgi:hypothetical protein